MASSESWVVTYRDWCFFDKEDQKYLDDAVPKLTDFEEIPVNWWTIQTARYLELGYGGAACTSCCCGAPRRDSEKTYSLNERQAVIGNADGSEKTLFATRALAPIANLRTRLSGQPTLNRHLMTRLRAVRLCLSTTQH